MTELPKSGDLLLGKYLLEERLGEGGMGIVYAARHELLGQRVAVKLIRPEFMGNGISVARFLNEARAAARIENDHVARVLDVGILDGTMPYMVLEYLDGIDLAALSSRGPLPVAEVADYLLQAIEGLAHAHALGIVHRDLKPSNLYIARRPDGTSRVKVLDFGISKATTGVIPAVGTDITKTTDILGTPLYMSPEQLRSSKNVDQRSDIWALGVVAYELLTGAPPFTADNAVALFATIQEQDPPSLRERRADIAEALDLTIQRCVRRIADHRFASVTELAAALVPFATASGVRAYENTARILPLTPSSPVDSSSDVHPIDSGESVRAVSAPGGRFALLAGDTSSAATQPFAPRPQTGAPWATSGPNAVVAGTGRRRGLAIAGLVATLAVAAVIVAPRVARPRIQSDAGAPSATQTQAAQAASSVENATAVPDAAAGVPAASSSEPVAAKGANGAEVAHSAERPARPKASSSAIVPARPPRSCKPPYTIDANGDHHWKPECL